MTFIVPAKSIVVPEVRAYGDFIYCFWGNSDRNKGVTMQCTVVVYLKSKRKRNIWEFGTADFLRKFLEHRE